MLARFHPHGVFIALEELGFLLMSGSLLCMAPVFAGRNRLEAAIRWLFVACFALTILAFTAYSVIFGINREYRFEVAAISINWITLLVGGILLSLYYRKRLAPQP